MKRFGIITLLFVAASCAPAQAASLRTWFWGAVTGNCIAQASDGISTAVAIAQGAHEINPFLVHTSGPRDGQIDMPRLIAFKAVVCGLPVAVRYLSKVHIAEYPLINERTGYAAGLTLAAPIGLGTGAVAVHNFDVWRKQKER